MIVKNGIFWEKLGKFCAILAAISFSAFIIFVFVMAYREYDQRLQKMNEICSSLQMFIAKDQLAGIEISQADVNDLRHVCPPSKLDLP